MKKTTILNIFSSLLFIVTLNAQIIELPNGNVGIGITPLRPLHVKGNGNGSIPLLEGISNEEQKFFSFKRTDNTQEAYLSYTGYAIAIGTKGNERLRIHQNGNIGIRITDPKHELSVNGTIWSKEVKVSLSDAADWVFDEDYKLKPLTEVENYIKQNRHLPEIPSAEEFKKNDLKVSEMTNKLLQKIEELTLYTIQQQKEILELNKRLNKIETQK
ncbi:hypothetical protein [Wenyingzhuangia marina]|uniref:Uncharacterized protein n=1 Tax=Wenyingzhuangia marina TaxID=1195760 RepID=A0A1M5VBG1_9FLAO|nr:hypothetical protein [Wenyingzhuangia marina]GGF73251.1 hypothetical protein GCM10011397_15210 [Wenyingzhuangia marina]SHH72454.1 hypothetical protein SAMN05444281_1663 [Wenyingzhuangia marina]